MNPTITAVLLSCLLYSLYVLLPMIPAIVIYRMFPDTKVALNGPLANLTLKSSGAFAAYVIVVILGFFLIKNTHTIIAGMVKPMWTITATLELQDANGKKLDDQAPLQFLEVLLTPDVKVKEGKYIKLEVPAKGIGKPDYLINFKIPQFGEKTINTSQLPSNEVNEDNINLVLNIKNPITIQRLPTNQSPYMNAP
ncbi:MAG: hypothetical protein WCK32_04565 [Chlorobiaceae bacterium]